MAKKIALGVLGVLGLFIAVVLGMAVTKPDHLHIERSLVMRGTPADVVPYANDLSKLVTWIPWTKLDPDQAMEFSDPPAGVGAWYTWEGNDDVGKGRMEVVSAAPNEVVLGLEFIEPFSTNATATVSAEPTSASEVEVTWAFDEDVGFGSKVMMVFMDFEAMMGPDFEQGLANLKALVEAGAPTS